MHPDNAPASAAGPHRPRRRSRPLALAAAAAMLVVSGLAGCANGELPTAVPTELPSVDLPTVTISPPSLPEPAESEAPAEPDVPEDPTFAGLPLWLWMVMAIVPFVSLVAAISRRVEARALTKDIRARGAWVVDHGTGALLSAQTPDATQLAWSHLDGALVALATDLRRLEPHVRGERSARLWEISEAVAAVRMSAETDAKERLAGSAASGASEGLFAARRRLADALAALDPDS
ncbi:MAG: hypothetical protein ACK5LS_05945 [Propioniciclava sp.]